MEGATDRDRLAILARLESETGRDGALSVLDATVRRGLKRAITRQRRAVIVNRWRQSMRASAHAPSTQSLL
ncbi:MAG TPA: hypothetical protein VNF29_12145 [Candidatus Binataceae bacterium]|nr:hypothetical protein [Candidatus Binataceae bacterium]